MPVVWGTVMLAGLLLGIAYYRLPAQDTAMPTASGNPTLDLTAAINRWLGVDDLPTWQRLIAALATILTAVAGLTIAKATGEVFLGMPFSWWAIGMVILASIGTFEIFNALRMRND